MVQHGGGGTAEVPSDDIGSEIAQFDAGECGMFLALAFTLALALTLVRCRATPRRHHSARSAHAARPAHATRSTHTTRDASLFPFL